MSRLLFAVLAAWGLGCIGDSPVQVEAGAPTPVTSLRNPSSPDRPPMGTVVTVANLVVTNVKAVGNSKLFFAQDATATSWAGVMVFVGTSTTTVAPGAVITATGTFTAYKGLEEIDVSAGTYTQTGTAQVPPPIEVAVTDINANGARALELQSMLVRVRNVVATAATVNEEFSVADPADTSQTLIVSSFWAADIGPSPFPATQGEAFASITGNCAMSAAGTTTPVGKLGPGRAEDVVPQ
jgi:hypothetical protein